MLKSRPQQGDVLMQPSSQKSRGMQYLLSSVTFLSAPGGSILVASEIAIYRGLGYVRSWGWEAEVIAVGSSMISAEGQKLTSPFKREAGGF